MADLCFFVSSLMPVGVRGAMNKWAQEVLPGIYVGHLTTRVREELWVLLTELLEGEAVRAYAACIRSSDTEQGYVIETYGDHRRYRIEDFQGLALISRVRAADLHDPSLTGSDDGSRSGLSDPDW